MKRDKQALNETVQQEFKKDLELFEYFLVLLNNSSPIRNVELMWDENLELFDPAQRPRVNTGDALVQLQPVGDSSMRRSSSPSTYFCDLVHGFGTYEEQTCARSDKPAKERCRATGCSHVYPCHVGLTDIAVPVVCDGRYLGTLFSGQVLTRPPSPEGFAYVRNALEGQPHIDIAKLEEAYYRVPVVTAAQLAEVVRMMEVFARYLANAWKRLKIMGEFQHMRERELALDRRELTELLLSGRAENGTPGGPGALRMLARNVGLEHYPDRVLVLRLRPADEDSPKMVMAMRAMEQPSAEEIVTQMTLVRVAHMIEDRCRRWPNTLATMITPDEMCVLTFQKPGASNHERLLLDEIAHAILHVARSQGLMMARIGISGHHQQPTELLRAYQEAVSALDAGHSTVNWFEALPERPQQPIQALGQVLRALQAAEPSAITVALREFLAAAAPSANIGTQLQQTRGLLTWACEHLAREFSALVPCVEPVNASKEHAIQIILSAPSFFVMTDSFRGFIEQLRQQAVRVFSQRERKIVSEIHRLVREKGPEKVTIQSLARDLALSTGHLGRIYSRSTGQTLEEFLIRQKLEMGKRLLLDPRLHVSEVADQCGFCNPAYFASVFKKYMHCTPRAYANQPQRWRTNGSETPEEASAMTLEKRAADARPGL